MGCLSHPVAWGPRMSRFLTSTDPRTGARGLLPQRVSFQTHWILQMKRRDCPALEGPLAEGRGQEVSYSGSE